MRKRRQYLINYRFQLTFIGFILICAFFVIFEVYIAHLYFFKSYYEIGSNLHLSQDNVFYGFLNQQKIVMNRIFLILSLSIFGSLSLLGLIFSHRIAGPLYQMKKQFLAE